MMAQSKSKSQRRAVVTGASAGIGAAFARRLARDGYDLVLVARSHEKLDALAKDLRGKHGVGVEPLPADLTDAAQLRVVEDVVGSTDALDLLVNNAGFGTSGRFSSLDIDEEEAEIRLNVVAVTRLARSALPAMLARKQGAIINVSSMAAFQPAPYNATYAATKAFVNSLTESLFEEVRGSGVVVQALCPGFTRTDFQQRAQVDVSRIPEMMWMSAEAVVDASLAALQRRELICVPGTQNKLMATLTGALPRSLTRRLVAAMTRAAIDVR
jgi:short-subunit dehydrogenase